jgi:hypothetical protein
LTLKGYAPRILFHDVNADCNCYPARNWLLQANLNYPSYPQDEFFIQDLLSGEIPFSVQGGAEEDSLVVGLDGKVGIGTEVPLKALHVVSDATPTLRLEQPVSPGPARIWDLGANATQFFVSDVTASSNQPFSIRAGAPTSSINVAANGNVGLGTSAPVAALDVVRNTGALAMMARFANNKDIQVLYDRTDAGAYDWQTSNFNTTFQISIPGSSIPQFSLMSDGNLRIGGTQYLTGSSRDLKENFVPVDGVKVLQHLVDMPLTEWNAKSDPGQRHIGPVAEDWWATFGLGPDDKHVSMTDVGGVALAAIKGLHQVVAEKATEIAALRADNSALTERIAALEAMVSALMNRTLPGAGGGPPER